MGQHKLLLEMAGQTLLQRAVQTALAVHPTRVLVVLGRDAKKVQATLGNYTVDCVVNPDYETGGMESSFRTAIAALEPRDTIFMLADMPLISSEMLLQLKAAFLENQPLIAASRFAEIIAPPHLFSSELLPILGTIGAKPLILRNLERTIFLEWEKEKLFDVDTPEDWAKLEALHQLEKK